MSVKFVYPLAILAVVACASGGSSANTLPGGMASRTNDVITAVDMTLNHADDNSAYDAIARLKPNWLASHGVTSAQSGVSTQYAMVYVNGQQYGPINSLRNIRAFDVVTMRYYDVTQAGAAFGLRAGAGGVIEVTTR
jgi:hypothetical protein